MQLFETMMPSMLAASDPMDHVKPIYWKVMDLPENSVWAQIFGGPGLYISNATIMSLVVAGLMLALFPYLAAKARRNPVPTGAHNFFEAILSFLRTEVFRPVLKENTDRFAPVLWTVFFFVLFSNLLGLLPIYYVIQLINKYAGTQIPNFWSAATSNVSVTAGLAIFAFLLIHLGGIWEQIRIAMDPSLDPHHHHDHGHAHGGIGHGAAAVDQDHHDDNRHHEHKKGLAFPVAAVVGFFKYWWNFAPHDPWWLWFPLFPLEIIGALVKPFSLCMRLFANIMAGHVVMATIVGLIFVAESVAMRAGVATAVTLGTPALSVLELFVSFLQAYIFTFLTTLFLAGAVAPEH